MASAGFSGGFSAKSSGGASAFLKKDAAKTVTSTQKKAVVRWINKRVPAAKIPIGCSLAALRVKLCNGVILTRLINTYLPPHGTYPRIREAAFHPGLHLLGEFVCVTAGAFGWKGFYSSELAKVLLHATGRQLFSKLLLKMASAAAAGSGDVDKTEVSLENQKQAVVKWINERVPVAKLQIGRDLDYLRNMLWDGTTLTRLINTYLPHGTWKKLPETFKYPADFGEVHDCERIGKFILVAYKAFGWKGFFAPELRGRESQRNMPKVVRTLYALGRTLKGIP